jgi:rubrerythrin
MRDVMTITRPYKDDDGKMQTEVVFRCLKCGNDMEEKEFDVVCPTCGNTASCCDGEVADASV